MAKSKNTNTEQFSNAYSDESVETKKLLDVISEALLSKKANDITLLDVSELTTLTDYFVVCHGNSDTQIKAIADAVEEDVQKHTSEKAWRKEGLSARTWIILDFVNVVVHVMNKEKRDYYGIEKMWNDAKVTQIID